jgi:hypothetical protein
VRSLEEIWDEALVSGADWTIRGQGLDWSLLASYLREVAPNCEWPPERTEGECDQSATLIVSWASGDTGSPRFPASVCIEHSRHYGEPVAYLETDGWHLRSGPKA